MHLPLSRRQLLIAAASATAVVGPIGRTLAQTPAAQKITPVRLSANRRTIEVNGKSASVFGIRQQDGTPGLTLAHTAHFNVTLENRTAEPTIVHWHGQTPPPDQDGVVDTGFAALIDAGGSRTYDFAPRVGTHWMHSHHGLQEQLLMAAPLIVRAAEDLRADVQEVIVLLHDFTFRDPAEMLADVIGRKAASPNAAGVAPQAGMNAGQGMDMTAGGLDLNDVEYDAYLANDRTLDDPLVIRAERAGRVRLRLINGATSTAFWIDLGMLEGSVIAADGNLVQPVAGSRFPLAQGQRLDIMVQLPRDGGAFPVFAQREGDRQRTGIVLATPTSAVVKISPLADAPATLLDLSLEQRLSALRPLGERSPGVTHRMALTGTMQPYVWSIDDQVWANHRPVQVAMGDRVVLEMVNRSPMAHPMHLHGHHFQVVAIDDRPMHGAMRDTVLVPAGGSVAIAFDADNPGRWLLHCHNLLHMATGMMTEIAYAT